MALTAKIWVTAIALFASFLIATNWQEKSSTAKDPGSSLNQKAGIEYPLVIGYSNWVGWWPWAIAEQEGLFAKHGVQVELRWYDNYSESLEALATGAIDANCQTLSDTISFAPTSAEGEIIVLVNDNSAGNDKIIAAGEKINSVKDLKDEQIATEAGVVSDFLLALALEKEGLSRDQVKIISAETGAATEAFIAGNTNAVSTFAPFWLNALKRQGAKEIASSADFPGAIPDLLVVGGGLIESSPRQIQALVDTWFDILDFMAEHPGEADEIMANRAGIPLKRLQLFKSGTRMFSLEDNIEAFSKGNDLKHLPYAIVKTSDFLQRHFKFNPEQVDLSQILNSDFVESYEQNQSFNPIPSGRET